MIKNDVHQLEKEIAERQAEIDKLKELQKEFPDLIKQTNRWGRVRYCSKSVNDKVNRFDMSHNCGCCADSPLEVWPYLETEHGDVYSDPPRFTVGERDWYSGGDTSYPGWEDRLREHNIPETIIDGVSKHFQDEEEDDDLD